MQVDRPALGVPRPIGDRAVLTLPRLLSLCSVAKSSRLEGIDETQRTADQAKAYTNNVYRGLAGPVPRIFR